MPEYTRKYDIVIPHYGTGLLTQLAIDCLASIRLSGLEAPADYRVILIDNASPEFDLLADAISALEDRISVVRVSCNLGFIKATNLGISLSDAEYVVLLNNDTIVCPGWLGRLEEAFVSNPRCGLSGPLTDAKDAWQGRWQRKEFSPDLHTLAPGRMLAFFCTMIHSRVFRRIGLLDEAYGVGFGDDDEFCRRAQATGFDLVLQQGLVVHHRHRSTFRTLHSDAEIKELQDAAMKRFRAGEPAHPAGRRRLAMRHTGVDQVSPGER